MEHHNVFAEIKEVIQSLDTGSISSSRKKSLRLLVEYIQSKINDRCEVRINFICTHNSRRSHLAQTWAETIAAYRGVTRVSCYSGGTEATALYPVVAETLKNQGFKIDKLSEGENPLYSIKFAENAHSVIGFSKTYDNDFNPKNNFAAVMTCSQADTNCPFIAGAEVRISIPYEDPKAFDNTPQQQKKYAERSLQIATELLYIFSEINK